MSSNPLDEHEENLLDDYFWGLNDANIPSFEALDGFFAALACCPDIVPPSEFLLTIRSDMSGNNQINFMSMEDLQDFLDLALRHYNYVNSQFQGDGVYVPSLSSSIDDKYLATDWATGFLRGVDMRKQIWREIIDSEEHGGSMVPIFAFAYEHHDDPEMRPFPEPMDEEKRDLVLTEAAAGVNRMYRYFYPQRSKYQRQFSDSPSTSSFTFGLKSSTVFGICPSVG